MRSVLTLLTCVVVMTAPGRAQEKPESGPPVGEKPSAAVMPRSEQPRALVPLKVQIVLSRFKGEKKIGSLPYILGVAANDRLATSLRMGIEVPIGRKGEAGPFTGINYRSVGTNIDCQADSSPDGAYRLAIKVDDTSVLSETSDSGKAADATAIVSDMPAFRAFKSNFTVILRDGQTTQYTSAADPISGEVMKIDVTLSVIK